MDELTTQLAEIYTAYPDRPPFLSLRQASLYLRCDPRTILSDGSFPVKKIGSQYRVPTVGMAKWILKEVRR